MADYDKLTKMCKESLSLADHNLNNNIIIGLDENSDTPVTLVNNVQIPNYPKFPKVFFKKQIWSHTEGARDINCGFINLPIIKHLSRAITTFSALRKEIKASKEPVTVFTYDLHLGISLALKFAKSVFQKVHFCAVLPDVPNAVVIASNNGKNSLSGRFKAAVKMAFIKQFDSYVILTEYIKNVAGIGKKPCVVVEGIYNSHQPPLPDKTTDKKIIFYSGQLNPAYGMGNLLNAFLEIYKTDQSYEFWICGGGAFSETIKKTAKTCEGLKYFGYVNTEKVRSLQAEASVLVNPRQNTEEFTKYSFPSKTMEYLASGRPVVGYKLDGIPDEYDTYIQYVPDNSVESLKNKLIEVCEMNEVERKTLGDKCRSFIIEKKNPRIMCERILSMFNE